MKKIRTYQISIVVVLAITLNSACRNKDSSAQKDCPKNIYHGVAKESGALRDFEPIPSNNKLVRYFDVKEDSLIKRKISTITKCEEILFLKLYKVYNSIVFHSKVILENKAQDIVGFNIGGEIFLENFGDLINLDLLFYEEQKDSMSVENIDIYGELVRCDNVFLAFYLYYDFKKGRFSYLFADESIPYGSYQSF